jgi:hypothetical protein
VVITELLIPHNLVVKVVNPLAEENEEIMTSTFDSTMSMDAPQAIDSITNSTVLEYLSNMNANDFAAVVDLFVAGGALQPPFQLPIVGREKIRRYLEAECQNIKILPDQGLVSYQDDELTRMRVTGKMKTTWSGDSSGLDMAWRFSLDAHNKISLVAIDLMSSTPA